MLPKNNLRRRTCSVLPMHNSRARNRTPFCSLAPRRSCPVQQGYQPHFGPKRGHRFQTIERHRTLRILRQRLHTCFHNITETHRGAFCSWIAKLHACRCQVMCGAPTKTGVATADPRAQHPKVTFHPATDCYCKVYQRSICTTFAALCSHMMIGRSGTNVWSRPIRWPVQPPP